MKPPLLFLCHRIPYPPNKGDKIRSFHLLHHLSQHFDIFLASFVDDPDDWPYVTEVEKFCSDCFFVEQKKWISTLRGLTGLITGEAMSIPFYASKEIHLWVRNKVSNHQIKHAMVFSSSMAQYVIDLPWKFDRKVVDFVDVDSDKWQQYSDRKPWPMKWLYSREARCLLDYEERLAFEFDAGLFVSSSEAELFQKLSPKTAGKIGFYNNGVNTEYFKPKESNHNPYTPDTFTIVFTGAMDYWPNIDAVIWFVKNVQPSLMKKYNGMQFYIVGSNPSKSVVQLANQPGVVVTGRVKDVRPYVQYATAVVAPMRIARGVQNKVLEAMAMEKTVIVSSKGLEGIAAKNGEEVLIADSEDEYFDKLCQVFSGNFLNTGQCAREYVAVNFDWDKNLPEVVLLLEAKSKLEKPAVNELVSHG